MAKNSQTSRGKRRSPRQSSQGNGTVSSNTRQRNGTSNQGMSQPRTPLLPMGVNNKATMPKNAQHYQAHGEEVVATVRVAPGSTAGQVVFNEQIGPSSCARLSALSNLWQRIDWDRTTLNIVALNGSVVTAGYNVGFIEDPTLNIPSVPSLVIPFLTSLRGTSVRQNWVQSESGQTVSLSRLPEMYTSLHLDPRRFYIGRLIMAVTGDVTTEASFQILLRYSVKLYVPRVVMPEIFDVTQFGGILQGPSVSSTSNTPYANSSVPIPPLGRYVLAGDQSVDMRVIRVTSEDPAATEYDYIKVAGFEVFGGVGGTNWSDNTRYLALNDLDNPIPWPNACNNAGDSGLHNLSWALAGEGIDDFGGDTDQPQRVFNHTTKLIKYA